MIIGADVGGTFTDIVGVRDGRIVTLKLPTSSPQSSAVAEAAARLSGGSTVEVLVHGTTVATNALLQRSGVRTALVSDAGFEDVIEIGRQDRPSLYDLFADRPEPLVGREDRIGVTADETPHIPEGVEAVAIAMIGGHIDGVRERSLRDDILAARSVPVSISSEVAPEFREFERTSTCVLNAYLTPVVAEYLAQLEDDLVSGRLAGSVSVMRSSGGVMSIAGAMQLPAAILLSGPAGGVVAAGEVAAQLGKESIISFDMGGTSTDVCLVDEAGIDVSYERSVDGFVCRLPAVGIHTVGAGGGSIAWIDAGGALRVGPESAGADPGPACYGRGGRKPTVTDANVVLGRIDPAAALGGSVVVSYRRAFDAIDRIGAELGLSVTDTALGICRIAEELMVGAVRTVSIDQGSDPAAAWLMAFGGAGGLHATAIARSLGMAGVVVPRHAGVFSALGLLAAPPRADATMAVHATTTTGLGDVVDAARALVSATAADVVAAGHLPVRTDLRIDVRYLGQAHEVTIPYRLEMSLDEATSTFEQLHLRRNGFRRQGEAIEIVAVRASSFGPAPLVLDEIGAADAHVPDRGNRRVVTSSTAGPVEMRIVERRSLAVGDTVVGPVVIEEDDATTFLDVGETATLAENGALLVTW